MASAEKKHLNMLNSRYKKLYMEFEEYLKFRSGNVTNKIIYAPLPIILPKVRIVENQEKRPFSGLFLKIS